MTHADEAVDPIAVVAARIKEVRRRWGLSQAQLADRMTAAGVPWDRSVVANLEIGRRKTVSVQELFACAVVLGVAPVHLLVPTVPSKGPETPDDPRYRVTPELEASFSQVREFIRGWKPLAGIDARYFYSEVPPHEIEHVLGLDLLPHEPLEADDGDR